MSFAELNDRDAAGSNSLGRLGGRSSPCAVVEEASVMRVLVSAALVVQRRVQPDFGVDGNIL